MTAIFSASHFSGQPRPQPSFPDTKSQTQLLHAFTFSKGNTSNKHCKGWPRRKDRMDPVHSHRSFAGTGGRSLELLTAAPHRPSNDLFINPARHYLDAASPRQRPYPSPRKSKKHGAISSSSSSSSVASSSSWWSNPEMKRKRRVVKYKLYAAEGKMKSSFKNGFRWIKRKCKKIVFGINY